MKCPDWARTAEARLPHLDELGIDGSLMFPTLASLLEERMRDDPDLCHAAVHAMNEWLYDEWQFNYEDRIFATPVIALPIVEKAIEELEWALEQGCARCVLIRPAPGVGTARPPLTGPAGVRPVLGPGAGGGRARRDARLGLRLRRPLGHLGGAGRVPARSSSTRCGRWSCTTDPSTT